MVCFTDVVHWKRSWLWCSSTRSTSSHASTITFIDNLMHSRAIILARDASCSSQKSPVICVGSVYRMAGCRSLFANFRFRNSCEEGVEGARDSLSCRSLFAKEPLTTVLFCGSWLMRIRYPLHFCHPVVLSGGSYLRYACVHIYIYIYLKCVLVYTVDILVKHCEVKKIVRKVGFRLASMIAALQSVALE